jgi:hypothetical protein
VILGTDFAGIMFCNCGIQEIAFGEGGEREGGGESMHNNAPEFEVNDHRLAKQKQHRLLLKVLACNCVFHTCSNYPGQGQLQASIQELFSADNSDAV